MPNRYMQSAVQEDERNIIEGRGIGQIYIPSLGKQKWRGASLFWRVGGCTVTEQTSCYYYGEIKKSIQVAHPLTRPYLPPKLVALFLQMKAPPLAPLFIRAVHARPFLAADGAPPLSIVRRATVWPATALLVMRRRPSILHRLIATMG